MDEELVTSDSIQRKVERGEVTFRWYTEIGNMITLSVKRLVQGLVRGEVREMFEGLFEGIVYESWW